MNASVTFATRRAVGALLFALLFASPAAAGPHWPSLVLGLGGTFGASGDPSNGGYQVAASGLWPVEGPLSFGVTAYADDIGSRLAQYIETGPPLKLLGTYAADHRFVYGAGWRLDYEPATTRRWRPFATASWDYARVQDDARGEPLGGQSAAGLGLGLGARRNVLQRSSLGVVVRYHRLADDRVRQYAGAALEWGWRFDKTP